MKHVFANFDIPNTFRPLRHAMTRTASSSSKILLVSACSLSKSLRSKKFSSFFLPKRWRMVTSIKYVINNDDCGYH